MTGERKYSLHQDIQDDAVLTEYPPDIHMSVRWNKGADQALSDLNTLSMEHRDITEAQ